MRKIQVGFSRARSPFAIASLLIRLFQWTPYSHCYVKFDASSLDRRLIYQASRTRVNFTGEVIFNKEAITMKYYELNVSDENYKQIMQVMIDTVGEPYGLLQLIGMLPVLLGRFIGIRIRNPFRKWSICSEAVYRVMKCLPDNYVDIYMERKNITKDELTPEDIDEAFSHYLIPTVL